VLQPVVGSLPLGILRREINRSRFMLERRKDVRSRTFLGGAVAFNRRASAMDCQVRNFSAAGAKITFANPAVVPDQFDLTITRKARSFRARMVWRAANDAGVAFVNEYADAVPIPLEWAKRLRDSESENAALRQQIAQLTDDA
jgi:hypothetical protein